MGKRKKGTKIKERQARNKKRRKKNRNKGECEQENKKGHIEVSFLVKVKYNGQMSIKQL